MNAPVYLDYNATTPVDSRVAKALEPYLYQHFGNPSSTHVYGRNAHQAVERARQQVALLIAAEVDEIVFCGCATEANNLAIRGAARALRDKGRHLVTSAVEHPAVEQPLRRLADDGWEVSVLPVDSHGLVSLAQLEDTLREDTVLVSVMHANNEVGTIQPLAEISAITRNPRVKFHLASTISVSTCLRLPGISSMPPRASARSMCAVARRCFRCWWARGTKPDCAPVRRMFPPSPAWVRQLTSRSNANPGIPISCAVCATSYTRGLPRLFPGCN